MAAHVMPPRPGAHERRLAERTRSARLIRESISLLSSKWSVDILLALGDGTRRYHELLEDLPPPSEHGNVGAFGCERLGDGEADTRRGTADDRRAAVEPELH